MDEAAALRSGSANLACRGGVAAAKRRVALCEVPHAGGDLAGRPRPEALDLVEPSEPHQRERMQHRVARQPREPASGLQRDAALPVHRRGVDEHVQVVGRIGQEALTLCGLLIGLPGLKARAHGVAPSPDPRPDVRRHVIDVARARDGIAKVLGARDRTLRLGRQLGHVDVEVTGARMPDVARQCAFERGEHAGDRRIVHGKGARAGQQQEQRLGVQRGHIQVVRIGRGDASHGVRVRAILIQPLRRIETLHVSRTHGANQRLLFRVRVPIGQRGRFLDRPHTPARHGPASCAR